MRGSAADGCAIASTLYRFSTWHRPLHQSNRGLRYYKQGDFDFLRVLSARQRYFQANLVYIESLVEARKVLVEIEGLQMSGGLNPAALGTAIQTGPGGTRQEHYSTSYKTVQASNSCRPPSRRRHRNGVFKFARRIAIRMSAALISAIPR